MASPHPFSEKIVSSNYVSIWFWWKWVMILIPRPAFKHNIPDFHLITIIRYLVIIICFLDSQFSQERQCNSLGAILKGQRREVLCVSTLPHLRCLCTFPLCTSGNPLGQSEQNSQSLPVTGTPSSLCSLKPYISGETKWYGTSQLGAIKNKRWFIWFFTF